jgi:hypothetical protein
LDYFKFEIHAPAVEARECDGNLTWPTAWAASRLLGELGVIG